MATDTDVYRVVYRNGNGGWVQLTSNRHPHGLHVTLKSAKMCLSYHDKWEGIELKIQKLGVRTYSQFKDGTEVIYRAETAWVDVGA